ncbi:hypothetical protein F0562_000474 [Nyssa sinensis]|uniref:Uncharacterized protein n=1 Tax=Nyssa sinensis TaxID=561372 RepID=A0A5J5C3S9_9ASTE|nr:hypothetical protein F0562_000474 [Nyssa sinensis]
MGNIAALCTVVNASIWVHSLLANITVDFIRFIIDTEGGSEDKGVFVLLTFYSDRQRRTLDMDRKLAAFATRAETITNITADIATKCLEPTGRALQVESVWAGCAIIGEARAEVFTIIAEELAAIIAEKGFTEKGQRMVSVEGMQ